MTQTFEAIKPPARTWANALLVALILASAVFLRYSYNEVSQVKNPMTGDAAQYVAYALNLSRHHTFSKDRVNIPPQPDSYWAPGYPFLLAGMVELSSATGISEYKLTLHAQILMGVLTVLLTYLLGAMLLPGYWPLIPAALTAASPHLVSLGNYLLTETLFTFILLLSLYLACAASQRQSTRLAGAAGISLAIAYLVNPVSVFLGPLLAGAFFLCGPHTGKAARVKAAVTLILPLALAVTAWTLRAQSIETGDGAGSSQRLLANLIVGMHSDFHETWRANPGDPNNPATLDAQMIGQSYSLFVQRLGELFVEKPLSMLHWYLLGKPAQLWNWSILTGAGDIYIYSVVTSLYQESQWALASYALMKSAHAWLAAAAFLSIPAILIFQRWRQTPALFTALALVYISCVYIATQAETRYSIPLRPEMYLLAVYFIYQLINTAGRQSKPELTQTADAT